ncbi:cytochrome P450 [Russula aff. rugulosa BPL654]|nr:cytochrome P450 [Russula aff. rugulosa BPL654]
MGNGAGLSDEELIGNMFIFLIAGHETYEDMSRFTQSLAVFYETLRLFPPVSLIPKIATEDTTLTVGNVDGGMTTFPVPSGTQIDIHVPGLHFNPRYWEQPHKFMPERFLGDWPRDAFLPFSQGHRACLGRRFFETEGLAIMTMLVSRYKIEVKESLNLLARPLKNAMPV